MSVKEMRCEHSSDVSMQRVYVFEGLKLCEVWRMLVGGSRGVRPEIVFERRRGGFSDRYACFTGGGRRTCRSLRWQLTTTWRRH